MLSEEHGFILKDIVIDWFLGGAPEGNVAMTEFFGTPCHLCFQLARGRFTHVFEGGHVDEVPKHTEMLAFTTPCVFHVGAELLLTKLTSIPYQERGVTYHTAADAGHSLRTSLEGIWVAPCQTSFQHC